MGEDVLTADRLLGLVRDFRAAYPPQPPELRFYVVPSWITHQEKQWVVLRPGPCPLRGNRKGTRRQWGMANPRGLRLRWVTVYDEPDHAIRTATGEVYCTAAQYAAIKARVRSNSAEKA
jgi:hypothetical protein